MDNHMQWRRLMSTLTIFASICLLAGCGDRSTNRSINEYIQQVKSQTMQPIESIPEIDTRPHYAYGAYRLRSPFEPNKRRVRGALAPNEARAREPLENYALDALQLVGIMNDGDKSWALLAAPNHTVYRVSVGNYIGRDFGKIIAVYQSKIKIRETIPSDVGGWRNVESSLSLDSKT